MRKIILASASPRRKRLLEKAGIKFKVVESKLDEYFYSKLKPHDLAKKLSLEKAKAVCERNQPVGGKQSVIIAADTLVVCGGKILGKPKDKADAKKMLEFLNEKVHSIITGFTIIDGSKVVTKSEETKVYMRKISENEINSYLETKEPFDKAGAYAIQGKARKFIEKIEGDFDNAVGLPVQSLVRELKKLGAS